MGKQIYARDIIVSELARLERENHIKILLAVESGSRAWGFDSPDSDYDVRFIYVHALEWYLRVQPQADVIEFMSEDHLLDFSGWELRKALRLLRKTNPNLSDWLLTDKIYLADEDFLTEIRQAQAENYNPIHAVYHFFNIAKKHDEVYLCKHGYTLKRFLYFLRGLLACEYIMAHKCHPPVLFSSLVEATVPQDDIRHNVFSLLDLKRASKESDNNEVPQALVDYAYNIFNRLRLDLDGFRPELSLPDAKSLDDIMVRWVGTPCWR